MNEYIIIFTEQIAININRLSSKRVLAENNQQAYDKAHKYAIHHGLRIYEVRNLNGGDY